MAVHSAVHSVAQRAVRKAQSLMADWMAAHWATYLAGQRAALKARCLLAVQTAVLMAYR